MATSIVQSRCITKESPANLHAIVMFGLSAGRTNSVTGHAVRAEENYEAVEFSPSGPMGALIKHLNSKLLI
jgi:hypothetical protein